MKSLALIFLSIAAICIISCKKGGNPQKQYKFNGVISGYDMRACASPACGGLLITIKNDTAKNPPPYYHINARLEQLGINPGRKFPVYVNLTYKPDTGVYGTFHYIIVTKLTVVQ